MSGLGLGPPPCLKVCLFCSRAPKVTRTVFAKGCMEKVRTGLHKIIPSVCSRGACPCWLFEFRVLSFTGLVWTFICGFHKHVLRCQNHSHVSVRPKPCAASLQACHNHAKTALTRLYLPFFPLRRIVDCP